MLIPSRKLFGSLKVEPETKALVQRMTVRPTVARIKIIDKAIVDLKAAGLWTVFDFVAFPAAHDLQAAMLCWNNPAYNLQKWQVGGLPGSAGFVTDRGYVGTAEPICPYGYATKNSGNKYTTSSAHMAAFVVPPADSSVRSHILNVENGRGNFLASGPSTRPFFYTAMFSTIASTGTGRSVTEPNSTSLWLTEPSFWSAGRRTAANNSELLFRNGANIAVGGTSGSTTTDSSQPSYFVLIGSNTAGNAGRIGFISMGGNLTDAQHALLNTIVRNYMTAIGAPTT